MSKQILVVQGGGRPNGNTAQLMHHFVRGAEVASHTVDAVSLLKKRGQRLFGLQRLQVRETLRPKRYLQ